MTYYRYYANVIPMSHGTPTPQQYNQAPALTPSEQAGVAAAATKLGVVAAAAAAIAQPFQTEARDEVNFDRDFATAAGAAADHAHLYGDGFMARATEILAHAPDMNRLMVSIAVVGMVSAVMVAERLKRGAEAPDRTRVGRFVRNAGGLALSAGAAYGMYKFSGELTPFQLDVLEVAGVGATGVSAVYAHKAQANARAAERSPRPRRAVPATYSRSPN